ncbi:hypothetical protein FACS189430_01760 [Bacteroidia bacterium]|nr:hypothetical protein FACS189430_01760 [Bacteroidia bacterium]
MQTVYFQNNTPYSKSKKFKLLLNGQEYILCHPVLNVPVEGSAPMEVKVKYYWERSKVYHFEPKDGLTLRVTLDRKIETQGCLLGICAFVLFTVVWILLDSHGIARYSAGIPVATMGIYCYIHRKTRFTIEEVSK